ncbi:hypothetical protein OBBRIDRAFT_782085 [Obba rivulosa]|uniref:Protein SMG7 n=1 Tax=Obba rivulosa TaxID=1052685 RepID=A0A8E2AM31_9APHY|nr:hypothetical protein OBBRIDRAFT_782085 [Obba rivulosa]
MTEDAAHIAREAKSLHQGLKELLETRDPWEREVEFQRKNLRRQYLRLLFQHPYAPESQDAETHLWMQTSYQFISKYKRRITELDQIVHGTSSSRQQAQQASSQGQPRNPGGHGVVEYRKTLQRFRQFLAEEEKFWIQFAVRTRRVYALDDAQNALNALSIAGEEEAASPAEAAPRRYNPFPADSDTVSLDPASATAEQRESWLSTFIRALICLGDIERYKELYNEAGGRPRAGHESGPPVSVPGRGGRNRRGGSGHAPQPSTVARARNYAQARLFYEQARLLRPHDGHPFHQMAILDSYQEHKLDSLMYYYRALCVRQPFDTALENLNMALNKALERWRAKDRKKHETEEAEAQSGPARVKLLEDRLFVLHASWMLPAQGFRSISTNLGDQVIKDFRGLVSERVILTEIITKVIVLSQGALWIHHTMRPSPASNGSGSSGKDHTSRTSTKSTEAEIAAHILAVHRTLLDVGSAEIAETRNDAVEHDLAQRITATFRRTLPALRIASKWLRVHTRYVSQGRHGVADGKYSGTSDDSDSAKNARKRRPTDSRNEHSERRTLQITGAQEFWRSYAKFLNALARSFPQDRLPPLNVSLEEDIDLVGFLPLRKVLDHATSSNRAPKDGGHRAPTRGNAERVHPNEEQLMRIADLLEDAKALADAEECPLTFKDNQFFPKATTGAAVREGAARNTTRRDVLKPFVAETRLPPPEPVLQQAELVELPRLPQAVTFTPDFDTVTISSKTDDDPCLDAVRTALASLHDPEEEDEIVYMKDSHDSAPSATSNGPTFNKAPGSPPHEIPISSFPAPPAHISSGPLTPRFGPVGSSGLEKVSPPRQQDAQVAAPKGTTAMDLLRAIEQNPNSFGRSLHTRGQSSSSLSPFLGSGAIDGTLRSSIWSPSHESTSLMTLSQGNMGRSSLFPNYQLQQPASMLNPSHALSPSFPTQSSQQYSQGAAPAVELPPNFFSAHHRRVSHPDFNPPPLSQNSYDPFHTYAPAVDLNGSQYSTAMPPYSEPVYLRTSTSYQQHVAYQDRLLPQHQDPRDMQASLLYGHPQRPPMSQTWNNTG